MAQLNFNIYSLLKIPSSSSSTSTTMTKFDSGHKYTTSPVFSSPFTLAFIRLAIGIYTMTTLIVMLAWSSLKLNDINGFFSYFTHLTYVGICAYFFASGVQTLGYALKWRKGGAGVGYPLQRWWKITQAAHVVLQASVITFPILVTVVFWALLSSPDTFADIYSTWSNISVHILNTAFCLFEIGFTNSPPPPWISLLFTIIFLAGYLCIAYITKITQGFYAYSFLDPQKQQAKLAAYIVGIAVGQIIVFCIVRGLVVLRERWAERAGRVLVVRGGVGSTNGEVDEEWEEIVVPTSASGVEVKGKMSDESRVEEGEGRGKDSEETRV